jgi:hypothetical protein
MLERSERDTETNDTAARCTKQKCVASVNIEASHKGTLQRSVVTSWRISSVSKKVVIQSFQKAVVI